MNELKTDKIAYLDFANVCSALAVVFLHVNDCFWRFSATESYWFSANIIETIFYFAVPVFFMISGVTLLDFFDRYDLKTYFIKRIRKTVIPYLFWSLFGLAFQVLYRKTISSETVTLRYVIKGMIAGNLVGIYWFFPALFSVYLSIPVFAAVPKEKRISLFRYIAITGFVLSSIFPFLKTLFHLNLSIPVSISVGSGYLIYICAGYLIHHSTADRSKILLISLAAVTGFLVHAIGTYKLSMEAGEIVRIFKGYTNVPSILYSVGVFILFKYAGTKAMENRIVRNMVRFFSSYTFGIYLIHIFVLWTIVKEFAIQETSLVWRLSAPISIFLVSVIIIYLLRKIPFLHRFVP